MKWRETHREQYNTYHNNYLKTWYQIPENQEKYKKRQRNYYLLKKETLRLFSIYDAFEKL